MRMREEWKKPPRPRLPREDDLQRVDAFPADGMLTDALLDGARLAPGVHDELRIESSMLRKVSGPGIRVTRCKMIDSVIEGADFSNTDFDGAWLRRVVFRDCKLTGASFSSASLQSVAVIDCKLDMGVFLRAELRDALLADTVLRECNFDEARLVDCRIEGCDLRNAVLSRARTAGTDFRGSDTRGMIAAGEDLRGAVFDPIQAADVLRCFGIDVRDAD